MTAGFLPYGRQEISDADVDAVVGVLRSELITQGATIERFEQAMCDYLGARHAVAFASGTAALHGAAFAAELKAGDELITTPLTFVASANCALYQGAHPRFVDVSRDTWNLDTEAAAAAVGPRTKAVVAVSFAGLPVDLEPLQRLRGTVAVIEDASHALGGHRGGVKVGGAGSADMTAFSFHAVKVMTTGEGGMVTTENDELARRLRAFRTHGVSRERLNVSATEGGWYYDVEALGYNYRITDFQCALGLSQLQRLDGFVAARSAIASDYRERLADEERIALPPEAPEGSQHGHHLFVIRVLAGARARLDTFEALRSAGIGVQVHYIPIYRFAYYRDTLGYPQDTCPAAEEYYATAISLPLFPAMQPEDVKRVVHELQRALP
jgi:UDP-4-amino-4,6-dideoxy-N-acetyl-beta-L-altrosamine transaminase